MPGQDPKTAHIGSEGGSAGIERPVGSQRGQYGPGGERKGVCRSEEEDGNGRAPHEE
jgi:hypothetical protein